VRELGGLPLALDQAGAYIEETGSTIASYLKLYRERQSALLSRRGRVGKQHPEPVATTWALAFARVEALDTVAADILKTFAFLAPDAIPEQMLLDGASELGERLAPLTEERPLLDEAVATLLSFSLVKRKSEEGTLSVHRLVQAVLRASLDDETQRLWAERVVRAVNRAFPNGWDYRNWPLCQEELPHAQACSNWIDQWAFVFPEAANLCDAVGSYLQRRGQYIEAEAFLQRALAIGEQVFSLDHPDLAVRFNNLASLYRAQGRYEEAEPLYQRAIAIGEQGLGQQHPNLATHYNNLALLYTAQGRYEEAEPLYLRAVSIGEQVLGLEHPTLAMWFNNLANLYYREGRYQEAEPLLQRAIAIDEKVLGTEHPDLAADYNSLANLYASQARYQEAEPLYQCALAIREQVFGPEHPFTVIVRENLRRMQRQQNQRRY
jgi:tetratricopeptide (TPR) repeat protein